VHLGEGKNACVVSGGRALRKKGWVGGGGIHFWSIPRKNKKTFKNPDEMAWVNGGAMISPHQKKKEKKK